MRLFDLKSLLKVFGNSINENSYIDLDAGNKQRFNICEEMKCDLCSYMDKTCAKFYALAKKFDDMKKHKNKKFT